MILNHLVCILISSLVCSDHHRLSLVWSSSAQIISRMVFYPVGCFHGSLWLWILTVILFYGLRLWPSTVGLWLSIVIFDCLLFFGLWLWVALGLSTLIFNYLFFFGLRPWVESSWLWVFGSRLRSYQTSCCVKPVSSSIEKLALIFDCNLQLSSLLRPSTVGLCLFSGFR